MKKTIVITLSALMEVDASEVTLDDNEIDRKTGEIEDQINAILEVDDDSHLGWCSTRSITLDAQTMNCGKCAECGHWTTDREKPDSVCGLSDGAMYKNRLLCDDCLPEWHPWAF